MNALSEIKTRFHSALSQLVEDPDQVDKLTAMVRPAQDTRFGDYQANCAMPLSKQLGKTSREVATDLISSIAIDDLCQNVEAAGPGFINLKLDDEWIKARLARALSDERLGVSLTKSPRNFVVDYSSPNVAKPMHVGHIRSTVIGDAIAKILRFVGHNVVTDNHIGDWGTQFGMIIYGFKNFLDEAAYESNPVGELGRLYKLVRRIMDYHSAGKNLPEAQELLEKQLAALERVQSAPPADDDKKAQKKYKKDVGALNSKIKDQKEKVSGLEASIQEAELDSDFASLAAAHPDIARSALEETAALHEGDEINRKLWHEFLPHCRIDMQRIYSRLDVAFDHELGESFYHNMLNEVVLDFEAKGFARESDGALCVFMDNYDTPMIIRKRDGAFLYATTDLATIKHRMDEFNADAVLYVVDHRQSEHFEKLFDAARLWGYSNVELKHVSFGTVMGKDGKPFKTRSGDTVGLEGLLNEAESRALVLAQEQNEARKSGFTEAELDTVSRVVGIGGIKYADLSHNRSSDYVFDYDKMLQVTGNTAAYLQYGYARVGGIARKLDFDTKTLRDQPVPFEFENEIERELAVKLLRFAEALEECLVEYKPNILCNYLFDTTQTFFKFYDQCSVKDAASESLRLSRLQLCDITARTMETGLSLLGIGVMERM
ncbi:MAG: arginine--tRNA ligase [Planctomycetota bacterium]